MNLQWKINRIIFIARNFYYMIISAGIARQQAINMKAMML